jgi:hypothetical protein
LLGCPISRSLTTSCVCLELRPLPSTGVTRLQRYSEPLRHPRASGLSVTGLRLVVPDHALGLPVLRALSLCTCCRHYPGAATDGTASLIRSVMSTFPEWVVGSACASSFSRIAQRSLALRPAHLRCHQFVARLSEGFSHFVSSIAAPVASGWSNCRVGLTPTGKRRLITAHTRSGHRQSPKTKTPPKRGFRRALKVRPSCAFATPDRQGLGPAARASFTSTDDNRSCGTTCGKG